MSKTNKELSKIFYHMTSLLAAAKVDWRPQAYRKAAASLEGLDKDIKKLYEAGGTKALKEIKGVGDAIAKKIEQYVKTGKIDEYEKMKGAEKVDLGEVAKIPFMGPKTAQKLYHKLGVKSVKDLERAAKAHKISKLPGFGEKSEKDIIEGIKLYKARGPRKPYAVVKKQADKLVESMRKTRLANKIVIAGSLRRKKQVIGDIDLLAISKQPEKLMDKFTKLSSVKRVLAKGKTKSTIILKNNIQVDLRVIGKDSYGAALLYFTGSKQYNISLRKLASKKGYKLNEYGLFNRKTNEFVAGKTEKEILNVLGEKWLSPEKRK